MIKYLRSFEKENISCQHQLDMRKALLKGNALPYKEFRYFRGTIKIKAFGTPLNTLGKLKNELKEIRRNKFNKHES